MNTLLIFFAFPIAVIIVSVVLERLLNSPVAVASLIFAIFLVVTFTAFDVTFLIATLAYTILAFITALLTRILKRKNPCDVLERILQTTDNNDNNNNNAGTCNTIQDLLGANDNGSENNNCSENHSNTCNCRYGRNRR